MKLSAVTHEDCYFGLRCIAHLLQVGLRIIRVAADDVEKAWLAYVKGTGPFHFDACGDVVKATVIRGAVFGVRFGAETEEENLKSDSAFRFRLLVFGPKIGPKFGSLARPFFTIGAKPLENVNRYRRIAR